MERTALGSDCWGSVFMGSSNTFDDGLSRGPGKFPDASLCPASDNSRRPSGWEGPRSRDARGRDTEDDRDLSDWTEVDGARDGLRAKAPIAASNAVPGKGCGTGFASRTFVLG